MPKTPGSMYSRTATPEHDSSMCPFVMSAFNGARMLSTRVECILNAVLSEPTWNVNWGESRKLEELRKNKVDPCFVTAKNVQMIVWSLGGWSFRWYVTLCWRMLVCILSMPARGCGGRSWVLRWHLDWTANYNRKWVFQLFNPRNLEALSSWTTCCGCRV